MFILDCFGDGGIGVAVVIIGNNDNFGYSSSIFDNWMLALAEQTAF